MASDSAWRSSKELIAAARDRAGDDPVALTVRQLLRLWHAQARGAVVVRNIRRDLERAGLVTDPDFASGYIDNHVRLIQAPEDTTAEPVAAQEVSLKVGHLRAASQEVLAVRPDDSLARAQTLMVLNDYSQLAVASTPRSVQGAITWESIGRKSISKELTCARDATVPAEEVEFDQDLLPLLPRVADAGYVLVRGRDRKLSGIITAADVTVEFDALASPFFLLGEIERRLRVVIDEHFQPQELSNYREPSDTGRPIEGAEDLSLGEISRLLEKPDVWDRLHWRADRVTFTNSMDEVRSVRNRLMHFSPDLPSELEVEQMRNMLGFLKAVTP
jgi:restriction system protein